MGLMPRFQATLAAQRLRCGDGFLPYRVNVDGRDSRELFVCSSYPEEACLVLDCGNICTAPNFLLRELHEMCIKL